MWNVRGAGASSAAVTGATRWSWTVSCHYKIWALQMTPEMWIMTTPATSGEIALISTPFLLGGGAVKPAGWKHLIFTFGVLETHLMCVFDLTLGLCCLRQPASLFSTSSDSLSHRQLFCLFYFCFFWGCLWKLMWCQKLWHSNLTVQQSSQVFCPTS